MNKLKTLGLLILFMAAGVGSGMAQPESSAIRGKVEKWVVKGTKMQITYYPIADLQSYMNIIVSHRKAPDLTKNNKEATIIVNFPSPKSVDSVQRLFADQYLVIATDPTPRKIILTKIIPGNVFVKRISVVGFK